MSEELSKYFNRVITWGDYRVVREILYYVPLSLCKEWQNGYALLKNALRHKYNEIGKLLIDNGAKVNQICEEDGSIVYDPEAPLLLAVHLQDICLVQMILVRGGVLFWSDYGSPAMKLAIELGNSTLIDLLMMYYNRPGGQDTMFKDTIRAAYLFFKDNPRVMQRITRHCNFQFRANDFLINKNVAPLIAMIANGYEAIVELIISKFCSVKQLLFEHGVPAINYDESNTVNATHLLNYLLNIGANIDGKDSAGNTGLYKAVKANNEVLISVLLDKGASTVHGVGNSLIFTAVRDENCSLLEKLLENGADVNSVCRKGQTALMKAAYNGMFDIVYLLLFNRANVNAKSTSGTTALHIAATFQHIQIVEFLLAFGADINLTDNMGHTALQNPSASNNDTFKLLQTHLIKLKMLNLKICEQNLQFMHNCPSLVEKEISQEADSLNAVIIPNTEIPLVSFIKLNLHNSSYLANNQYVLAYFNGEYSCLKFPNYNAMLINRMSLGEIRRQLIDECKPFWNRFYPEMTASATEKIYSYLDNGELEIFWKFCKNIS